MNLSLSNHFKAITNLYAKGARTLVMPTAVDISVCRSIRIMLLPRRLFIRQRIIDFNTALY